MPTVSPDGKFLAYAVADAGKPSEIYVADYPLLRTKRPVTFQGGDSPVWSRDGRWLFFRTTRDREVQVDRVAFDGTRDPPAGPAERIAGSPDVSPFADGVFGRPYDVSSDGRRLLFSTIGAGGGRVDTTAVRSLTVIVRWRDAALRALAK